MGEKCKQHATAGRRCIDNRTAMVRVTIFSGTATGADDVATSDPEDSTDELKVLPVAGL
jgi:hypothetical protein